MSELFQRIHTQALGSPYNAYSILSYEQLCLIAQESYKEGQGNNRHHKVIYLYTVFDKKTKNTKILTYEQMEEFLTSVQDYQWFYLNTEPDIAFGNNWTIELRGDNSSMEDQYVCQEHESELFEKRG